MSKIKKLSAQEARKIAAGEVVERPANVVKELVENSIDADAKNISIYLSDAGKALIRVVDDGCGMSEEDAQLCFAHHATSKINSIEDLNYLLTFGFRGEALSSISSVSKVELVTKEKQAIQGISLSLENGEIVSEEPVSCVPGTDITIKDLFYNVPARLKFFKKSDTEWRQILQLFQTFCLAYNHIHFKLYHEDKLIYNCPVTHDLNTRITQLWDHNFAQNMINFVARNEVLDLTISGAISNHQFARFNRGQIIFFVNGRWVKNQNLSKALIKGYLNVLPEGKYPAAFVFISVPQETIDVNIHPRKEEVQFLHANKIETFIKDTTKKSLEGNLSKQINQNIKFADSITPAMPIGEPMFVKSQLDANAFVPAASTTFDFEQLPFFEPTDSLNTESNSFLYANFNQEQILKEHSSNSGDGFQEKNLSKNSDNSNNDISFSDQQMFIQRDYEIIGQFKKTYILLEKEEGLFLVDQHAAHERILYELFSKRFHDVATIQLIFPVIIQMTEDNLNKLLPYLDLLASHGIDADCFAKDQLIIQSTPVYLKDMSLDDFIHQIISWIDEYDSLDKDAFFKAINEKLHAQMACKAAVKAGDILTKEQMVQLLNDLETTENRFTCPHGRPTGWLLSLHEIEKKFKRKA